MSTDQLDGAELDDNATIPIPMFIATEHNPGHGVPPLGLPFDAVLADDLPADIDLQVASHDDPPPTSVKLRRERRRSRPRSKTIALKRLTRAELQAGARAYPPVEIARPRTRAECQHEVRPCPWVACKHHLYLDINPETGSIKINFPDLEPWELRDTCALDIAERGGSTLDEVGEVTNLTRERIRQLEVRGLLKLKALSRELR